MTPSRDIGVIIDEMIDHIDYVLRKTEAKTVGEFRADRDLRQSVERSLEIISEASRHLPDELKNIRPEISWRQVADFGNVLRHTYFSVNIDLVWMIITNNLPQLRAALVAMRGHMRD
jgi:uncharacterized protein with HEPN domain